MGLRAIGGLLRDRFLLHPRPTSYGAALEFEPGVIPFSTGVCFFRMQTL